MGNVVYVGHRHLQRHAPGHDVQVAVDEHAQRERHRLGPPGHPGLLDVGDELPDEQLISYIQKARVAGRTETMTLALSVLIYGYLDIVTRRVALKVPVADVDDVAHEAILSAIRSAFAGESIGEFRAWLNRITLRRIADYHRKLEGKPKTVPLLSGDEEDDAGWGEVPTSEFEGVRVDAERAIETAYGALGEAHQRIVDAYVFADQPASEVASEEGTSEDNVHQVASRFRRRVRELLEDGDS